MKSNVDKSSKLQNRELGTDLLPYSAVLFSLQQSCPVELSTLMEMSSVIDTIHMWLLTTCIVTNVN